MANNYQILSEDAIKYLCGLIRDLASVSEGIDNINLADDKTFSNIYIKNLIDKCLEDANAEAEKLVGALTHLTCEETAIQPTLDNSEINVIYLYSANGNPPYQQFLKISEDKLIDLGSTSISLEDYIKVADVAKDYATKVELKAVTDKIGTTTLTTTDTTITGAIEEVKGIAEGKADKSEIPTTLPANGGNSDTVNNHTVKSDVPENAVFTDTVYDDTELNAKLDGKADTDKVVKKIFIKDVSSQDARTLIQNHWSEFDNFEFYNLRIETAKWTWDAEIYTHTQEYGTVLLRSYGTDVPSVFYGKVYQGVWTWQELATMDKVASEIEETIDFSTPILEYVATSESSTDVYYYTTTQKTMFVCSVSGIDRVPEEGKTDFAYSRIWLTEYNIIICSVYVDGDNSVGLGNSCIIPKGTQVTINLKSRAGQSPIIKAFAVE